MVAEIPRPGKLLKKVVHIKMQKVSKAFLETWGPFISNVGRLFLIESLKQVLACSRSERHTLSGKSCDESQNLLAWVEETTKDAQEVALQNSSEHTRG